MTEVNMTVGFKAFVEAKVTDKMVHQFAELSGDFNPIHLDEEYAKTTRFGRRIAHGMIAGALISRALNEKLGRGGIYLGQNLKFVNPIYIDDDVTVEMEVRGVRKEKGIVTVDTIVKKTNGDICVKGEAIIMVPQSV